MSAGPRVDVDVARLDDWLRSCIHCGLCLPVCPTYRVTGDEAESPRGRLRIMAAMLDSEALAAGSGREFIDHCLGCLGCQTVCPSGVEYSHVLDHTRERLGPMPGPRGRVGGWIIDHILSRPGRLHLAARLGAGVRALHLDSVLPAVLRQSIRALPTRAAARPGLAGLPGEGDVAILPGCAQRVFSPEVLGATALLVRAAGGRPYVPRGLGCCGAMSHHAGSSAAAREMAVAAMERLADCESIVVPSAGCSAHLREYGELFVDDPAQAAVAARISARSLDFVSWLGERRDRLRFRPSPLRVAYHAPCHHQHAQSIEDAPHQLLDSVPGLIRLLPEDADRCCGSAGGYSLLHPELAGAVREEKMERLRATGAELILTANPGCELFLDQGFAESGETLPVRHIAAFLAEQLEASGSPNS